MPERMLEKIKGLPSERTGETAPEATPNDPIDNVYIYTTDIDETKNLFIQGGFDDPKIAEVYEDDFICNFNKVKRTASRTSSWAWVYSKTLWALYFYFKRRMGVRPISRRVALNAGYTSRLVSKHRQVLLSHVLMVLPPGVRRHYFSEKFFEQKTIAQIAEKYGISQQAVSKSIRRSSKKIKKSLAKTVEFSNRLRGGSSFFSKGGKKSFFELKKLKN
jgi:predicted DNA-binding protein YlxM (UPF0122 family)